ncbi:MAG: DUF4445 domain-containing protein [Thermoplasmata archaeon]|nr:DUF4445 domain-containing protein [Thermoplasmata archaeon]
MTKYNVNFLTDNKTINVTRNTTILEVAIAAGINITGTCGGQGKCGKCKVKLKTGSTELTNTDQQLLSEKELEMKYRLACQAKIAQELGVEIPVETRFANLNILTSGIDRTSDIDESQIITKISPNIQKIFLELLAPTLEDNISDLERLLRALASADNEVVNRDFNISVSVLKKLSKVLRESNWKITITLTETSRNPEIIDVEPGNATDNCYGIAFDIGTSTIVGYLMELKTGKELAVGAAINPQCHYGEDVVTRIDHTIKNDGGRDVLQFAITSTMNQIIKKLSKEAGINYNNIYECVFVGNTVMHHLFLKLNPEGLAAAPYVPVCNNAFYNDNDQFDLKINPAGYLYSLPIVAGYLGADAVAMILSAGIDKSDELKLTIDLGTNGEIILGSQNKIIGCSTAAGPAFEGGHITHGTRAVEGAIDSVKIIDKEPPELAFTTINNTKPIGITGSGLVDVVAELLKAGVIDASGKFVPAPKAFQERLNKTKDGLEFTAVEADQTQTGKPITLTQQDIREVQLTKAAINAGIQILMAELRVRHQDLSEVLMAGAFGNYINKSSALTIKLLPDIPLEKLKTIGNAAGSGAKLALLSITERDRAEDIAKNIEYIELSDNKEFQDLFVESMGF